MSIATWFKKLFPARVQGSEAALNEEFGGTEQKGLDEARIEAGGSGALGFPGEPDSHASPADKLADSEAEAE